MKRVSPLVGIIIIAATAIVLFGGVFGWQYFVTKVQNQASSQNTVDTSVTELKQKILSGIKQLLDNGYDEQLGLKVTNYIREYEKIVPDDNDIESALNAMTDKFGPCWGIPEGECRE
ncbi:MAG: hypothetical protein WCG60_00520 [bacterium]